MQLGAKETENERFAHYFMKTFRKTASLIANSLKAVSSPSHVIHPFELLLIPCSLPDRPIVRSGWAPDRFSVPVRQEYRSGLPIRGRSTGLCLVHGSFRQTSGSWLEIGTCDCSRSVCLREGALESWNVNSWTIRVNSLVLFCSTPNWIRW